MKVFIHPFSLHLRDLGSRPSYDITFVFSIRRKNKGPKNFPFETTSKIERKELI